MKAMFSHKIFNNILSVLIFITLFHGNVSGIDKMKVIHYTVNDGLPRNIVTSFVQDKYGYGWVGTRNGLARFDGYDFISYESLTGLFINSMVTDNNNNLWISSNNGLYLYNRESDSFNLVRQGYTHHLRFYDGVIYFLMGKNLMMISDNKTPEMVFDKKINIFLVTDKGIWYSSEKGGLSLFGKGVHLFKNKSISLIEKVDDNNLFVACNNGSLYVIKGKNKIQKINLDNHHKIFDIVKVDNEYWIATDGNGIFILDANLNNIEHIYNKVNSVAILPSNSIYDIFVSDDDVIWISSFGAGLTCLLPENMPFENISPRAENKNSLVAKEGYAMFIDGDKYLLGTNYGFSEWNRLTNKYKNHTIEKLIPELKGTKIRTITKDYQKNYWIATYDGLMGKYSPDFKLLKTFHPVSDSPEEIQEIVQVFNIDNKQFLIASLIPGKSLVLFNTQTGKTQKVLYDKTNMRRKFWHVASIRKNQSGQIVVLINRLGLFQYIPENNMIYNLTPEINEKLNLVLNDFYQDKQGNYWIATKVYGLMKFSPKGEIIRKWNHKDGLPANTVLRLESIDDKSLWISTIDGLCRLDMKTDRLQVFDSRHGLSTNEFSPRSSVETPDNKIIFGCSDGFVIVVPGKVVVDTCKTKVVISDIVFQNTSIKQLPGKKFLEVPLEETKKIVLPFSRNSFTIKFFTNDDDLPKYNNFAYRLKGLEKEWIYLGEINHTTYTNLSSGTYTFQIKSTNKSNIWNEIPTEIVIKILPPWYRTWLAYLLYTTFFISIIFLFFRYYRKRLKWKLELDMANYKAIKEHELTEKKIVFFTNISHDLKNAATLISAPVNDLLDIGNLKDEQIKKLKVIKRNAERLYKLNADLLEFRKITQNQLPLKVQNSDLEPVINNIYESFSQECLKKDIEYVLDYNVDGKVFVDIKKIEKILWNLLSNAVKYTPKDERILLSVISVDKSDDRHLEMVVEDTGKGFSQKHLNKIFDRFYQVEKNESTLFGGVGIGLFIVKELTYIHHGNINVESEPGVGSKFTVTIPADKKDFTDDEFAADEEVIETIKPDNIFVHPELEEEQPGATKKYNRQKIVIVEDNAEMRLYLTEHFSTYNTVYSAKNGKKGVELIKQKEPDIIISDVKMPEMTGYELCDSIKNDFNTSHIPVILLTANTALDDKIKGMYAGADSYITKPFEIHYLDAVVNSLLENRKKLREKFIGIEPVENNDEKLSKKDVEFINQIKELIFKNISDPELNIDTLVKHLAVSRSQLNRKIKSLTGLTPNNFIKTIRLKKAYELLREKDNRVSDVAYQTGFSDPNYFTICFKKEFGENPSQISS